MLTSHSNRKSQFNSCVWRIVISPIIPYDSPPCYHSSMRHIVVLFIHLIAVLTLWLAKSSYTHKMNDLAQKLEFASEPRA
jgi:hypothetical protein